MTAPTIGTGRAVEVLHDRGPATPAGADRWTGGSGYLIGGRLVLTAAHNVDYRQDLGDDEQLLVRTIAGSELAARVVLVCDEPSQVDLALLEISDPRFDEHLPPVSFARVNRDSPAPVPGCWAVGFPRFGEAGPVLPEGSRRETWQVRGDILPGGKLRAGLLSLQVTSTPQPLPASLAGSAWEGMSGAVVFATDPHDGEQAVGVVTTHHRPEGESALTVVPITAVAGLPTAAQWWHQLGVADPDALPVLPPLSAADQRRSRLTGERALKEHWDPRGRGVERAARPGWFFTGRRQALSQLVAWLTAAPAPADNVRVVTGGPGSGKSAVLARLVTMSNPRYRAGMPGPLAADDPVADLPPGAIDVAVHARTAPTDEVVSALAAAAGAPQADLDGLIERLLERREAFTIAVDALDEADDPPALALALRRLASETADAGVRLLVGTRPGGPDRRLITALGLSARDDDPALIDLDDPAYLSRDDLAEYVRRRLLLTDVPPAPGRPDTPYRGRETLAGQVADAVARAAYPTFLIGQLVSRALLLRGQPISPHDPGWQQFPKTVADAMDQYLASVGDQAEQDRVEDLLRPLAYARGDGLPLDDAGLWPRLATALARPGRSYTAGDVATLLDTAADYLIETVITGQAAYYRLYHQALSDRLRERDQQHPRPVSAAQTVYQCLLDTVARRPDGTRDWPAAHPYLHSQLAGHAADAGQLTSLLDDPGFLVAADPAGLFAALQRPGQPPAGNAQIYRHAYPHLPPGADTAGERASYLQLAARRHRARLADQLGQLPLHQPWTARWVRGQRPHPHYIAGRHDSPVSAVAVGERHGRPVIVSGGDDGTVRVWDLESGEPVLGPLTGHDGGVSAVAVGERHGRPVIVSGGGDGTVRVWDLESGEPVLGPLTGHDGCGDRGGGRRAAGPAGHRLRRRRRDGAGVGPGVGRAGARPAHRPRRRGGRGGGRRAAAAGRSSSPAAYRRDGAGVGPGVGRAGARPAHRPRRRGDRGGGRRAARPAGHRLRRRRRDGAGVGPGVGRAGARPAHRPRRRGVRGGGRRAARPAGHRLRRLRRDGAGVGPGVGRAGARPAHRPRRLGVRGGGRRAAGPAGHRLRRRRRDGAGVGPGVGRAGARPAHRPRRRGVRGGGRRAARPAGHRLRRRATGRCGCGTWSRASRCSARSPATTARCTRWRSASGTAGRSSSPAATTGRCGCGTWSRASRCSARSPATTAR